MGDLMQQGLDGSASAAAARTASGMQVGLAEIEDFRECPIDPTWILEGNPVARSSPIARTSDGLFTCGRWECTAGRFHFYYACDEIVHILDGSVTIEESGRVRTLRAGDVALLPQGLKATWTVHGYVKKFAIFRSQRRSLARRVAGRLKRLVQAAVAAIGAQSRRSALGFGFRYAAAK